jgi:integrase
MRPVVYDVLAALPRPHRGRVWPTGSIRTAFENAVTEANLDSPLRFHDLRHHFASWFVMQRGSIPELQVLLGHATLAMTMRYAHLSPKHLRDAMVRTERVSVTVDGVLMPATGA